MSIMIVGLLLFLGAHSVRVYAEPWRKAQIERYGLTAWKLAFSLVSLAGLVIAIYGYGLARTEGTWLWAAPGWTAHVTALIMMPAFVLLVAAYAPANHIRNAVRHPMLLGVTLWALAHLATNGRLGAIIFLAAFLAWALIAYGAALRRDQAQEHTFPEPRLAGDGVAIGGGLAGYAIFALFLHMPLIGVPAY